MCIVLVPVRSVRLCVLTMVRCPALIHELDGLPMVLEPARRAAVTPLLAVDVTRPSALCESMATFHALAIHASAIHRTANIDLFATHY